MATVAAANMARGSESVGTPTPTQQDGIQIHHMQHADCNQASTTTTTMHRTGIQSNFSILLVDFGAIGRGLARAHWWQSNELTNEESASVDHMALFGSQTQRRSPNS